MHVRPLQDHVIIQRAEEEHLSSGGIVIPDSAAEKPIEGKVLAVGNGRIAKSGDVVPLIVEVGNRVLFGKYSGTEITLEEEKLLVMRETDIMAILDE